MEFKKVKTAVIGCGMIFSNYMANLVKLDVIDVVGCSDLIDEKAQKRAEQYNIKKMTNEEIFASEEIELVINLTYPLSHYEVAKQALLAGKHVYNEKMICITLEEAQELQALAKQKNLFFGGAPETYFSAAFQCARHILDSGLLGQPVMAQAFLSRSYRHHRSFTGETKRFPYCKNGGILFDMGSYYLTALVFLLGAVKSVTGFTAIREPERVFQNPNGPLYGQPLIVESTNMATGSFLFESGVMATFTTMSESPLQNHFYIYCTDGYIDLGDPNQYDNTIRIVNKKGVESVITSPFAIYGGSHRGYGAAEAMYAHMAGRKARCDAELCTHILEIALGLNKSSETGTVYNMTTRVDRPAPFKPGYTEYPELSLKD